MSIYDPIDKVFEQFSNMKEALIDASSLIYMNKAGYLDKVLSDLKLFSLQEIIEETGYTNLNINIVKEQYGAGPNDKRLISCADKMQIPVISDDKQILLHMRKKKVPYFNSIMVLNYLLYKGTIDISAHTMYYEKLKLYARYSVPIMAYSRKVYLTMMKKSK